jgi:60 kDa SS-A/Ro ribonucleoprotein
MTNYALHFNPSKTPVTEKAKPNQVLNKTGGYVFQIPPEKQMERFILLGNQDGYYYASEQEMTRENAKCVLECFTVMGVKAVEIIAQISESGRAPKNDPAIFALALAMTHDSVEVRKAAYAALSRVCRTGTMLFSLVENLKSLGKGWSRGLENAVANWYESKNERNLMYQVTKYQQRNGVSNADLFRLSHPDKVNPAIAQWITGQKDIGVAREVKGHAKSGIRDRVYSGHDYKLPEYLVDFDELKTADEKRTIELIQKHKFTHEMIDTRHKNSADVWEALLQDMPLTALIRNLGKMTQVGLIKPLSQASKLVAQKLTNEEHLKKSRVHPLIALSALRVYAQGRGDKGSLVWSPVPQVIDALNETFYLGFNTIEPTGKNHYIGLDVSGSMAGSPVLGLPGLMARDVAGCIAMVQARVEKNNYLIRGFCHRLVDLNITPAMRLDQVLSVVSKADFGSTNISAPMADATVRELDVDVFQIITDNDLNHGSMHPFQALKAFRKTMNKPRAKLVVMATSATKFSVADPSDVDSLDICGFDSAAPALLADFVRN